MDELSTSAPTSPPTSLPDSGDGIAPPAPDALPHPEMWSDPLPGQAPVAFDGKQEDEADVPQRTPARQAATWAAVAMMALGAVLCGFAVALQTWVPAVAGVVVGLAGLGLAAKMRILTEVSVGQSPTGPG